MPWKGRDRPLVVDDVENDRRLVGRGEDEGCVKIAFGGGAVADPAGGDPGVALDGRRHRPADGLDILGAEIAGDGEEAVLLGGVEDRQLPALQGIGLVGIDLVHHVDHRIAAGNQEAGLAVGRKVHVAIVERAPEGAGYGFLAHMLHVEGGLALALGGLHACIEGAQRHHVLEPVEQFVRCQKAGPGTHRLAVTVENPDDGIGEIADLAGIGHRLRAAGRCRRAGS